LGGSGGRIRDEYEYERKRDTAKSNKVFANFRAIFARDHFLGDKN
jgi:hypothetical protein